MVGTLVLLPMYIPSPRKIDGKSLNEVMIDYLKSEGFPLENFKGDVTTLRGAVASHKRKMSEETGLDFSQLTDDQLTADYHYNIFPTLHSIFLVSKCGCLDTGLMPQIQIRCILIG